MPNYHVVNHYKAVARYLVEADNEEEAIDVVESGVVDPYEDDVLAEEIEVEGKADDDES